jgi:adenosylcobinamide-GDP ribazoletransferase
MIPSVLKRLAGAFEFLTILPVRSGGASLAGSAVFFPLVGAALGAAASLVYLWLNSSILALLFLVLATGAIHEDALADTADAFRAGREPEKILAILKDSRIGAFGALALIFSILIRWQALTTLGPHSMVPLVVSETLPRAAFVALAYFSKPAGSGLGSAMTSNLSRAVTILAAAQGVGAALLAPRLAPILLLGTGLIVWIARSYFHRRIGGVTGDCLGATGQVVECFCLLVFVWAPSI